MNINLFSKIGVWVGILFYAIAYLWGVISLQHYLPGQGFYISLILTTLLAVGSLCIFTKISPKLFALNNILWLLFLVLILLQPILNKIVYIDRLIIPAGALFLCALLSFSIANLDEDIKKKSVIIIAYSVICAGVLTVLTQFIQLLNIESLMGSFIFIMDEPRLGGNIAQVNQASCVIALAMAGVLYLLHDVKKISIMMWGIGISLIFWCAMGIGFTASRGGLILAVGSILSGSLFYKATLKKRLIFIVVFSIVSILGYVYGTYLMKSLMQVDFSAVGRITSDGNTYYLRVSLLHQAWLAFIDNPITGQGWGGMVGFGLQHAEQLAWFTIGNHAHNIIAQLAAELGVLGLILFFGFIFVLCRHFSFKHQPHIAFSYSVLFVLGLYSFSEYPLWYMRFLMLVVFFVAIIDEKYYSLKINLKPVSIIASLCLVLMSCYYIVMYQPYIRAAYAIYDKKATHEEQVEMFKQLPNMYGYGEYKELMLYILTPISIEQANEQIKLGERVFSRYLVQPLLIKQANLLTLAGRSQEADVMYQRACFFDFIKGHQEDGCLAVIKQLRLNAEALPEEYQPYLERFTLWYKEKYQQDLPIEK